jgi:phosphomannomutase
MAKFPEKLQGTDGIRGRIADDKALQGSNPVDFFLETGFLTPLFFERYTYAFGTQLTMANIAEKDRIVVVGWDPRDTEGSFNEAAISGLRKAGCDVLVAGTLPTPALPLYMLSANASGCVVLTASHNPSDQNGIKLFFGHTALKTLPPDDKALTKLIKTQRKVNFSEITPTGDLTDKKDVARQFFIDYCLEPENSWIKEDDFSDTIVVIDASNGAVAPVAEPVFSKINFREVVYTNLEGNINEYCGVADIEGLESISRENVMVAGAKFEKYETLKTLFAKADEMKQASGDPLKLTGLVFDGDGDRCFRLDYTPHEDALIISSGDLLGIHQAAYLKQRNPGKTGSFINTVESDLNTAITAREMGFTPILTGVGDKWILCRAVVDLMQSYVPESSQMAERITRMQSAKSGLSGLVLSKFWKDLIKPGPGQEPIRDREFTIGIEESGHCITPGFIKSGDASQVCFSGNGIKSGLNSLKATQALYGSENWYQKLQEPFEAGVRETFYTYYVDKSRILPESSFRIELEQSLSSEFSKYFPSEFTIEFPVFQEEKEMLYGKIMQDKKQCAAVFMRNSGTEDKCALYLRGEKRLLDFLQPLGAELHLKLLLGMKNAASEFLTFEINLLKKLANGDAIDSILETDSHLPLERILKEIEFKEGLIEKDRGKYTLTSKGIRFIDEWK